MFIVPVEFCPWLFWFLNIHLRAFSVFQNFSCATRNSRLEIFLYLFPLLGRSHSSLFWKSRIHNNGNSSVEVMSYYKFILAALSHVGLLIFLWQFFVPQYTSKMLLLLSGWWMLTSHSPPAAPPRPPQNPLTDVGFISSKFPNHYLLISAVSF